jgi:hypothetical protein
MSLEIRLIDAPRGWITLGAFDQKREVGKYSFYPILDDNGEYKVEMNFLCSEISGVGIPRKLLSAAYEKMQDLATKSSRPLTHNTKVADEEVFVKMKHLLSEYGYKPINNESDLLFQKMYFP